MEHIHGHLLHRCSVILNQVIVASTRNPCTAIFVKIKKMSAVFQCLFLLPHLLDVNIVILITGVKE